MAGPGRRVRAAAWGFLATGGLMTLVGVLGLVTGQPLLFPSLGPTAFLQAESPPLRTARPYNVLVGHAVGIVAGYVAVLATGAVDTPAVFAAHALSPERVVAGALAIAATFFGTIVLHAQHPPAAATTLLIALGGFRAELGDALAIVTGVLIIAVAGEVVRRFRPIPETRSPGPSA